MARVSSEIKEAAKIIAAAALAVHLRMHRENGARIACNHRGMSRSRAAKTVLSALKTILAPSSWCVFDSAAPAKAAAFAAACAAFAFAVASSLSAGAASAPAPLSPSSASLDGYWQPFAALADKTESHAGSCVRAAKSRQPLSGIAGAAACDCWRLGGSVVLGDGERSRFWRIGWVEGGVGGCVAGCVGGWVGSRCIAMSSAACVVEWPAPARLLSPSSSFVT
eukprot:3738481-Pleurochrysis_carterae.AAC.2